MNSEAIDGYSLRSLYQYVMDSKSSGWTRAGLLQSRARPTYKREAGESVDLDVLRTGSFHKHGRRYQLVQLGQGAVQRLAFGTVYRNRSEVRENGGNEKRAKYQHEQYFVFHVTREHWNAVDRATSHDFSRAKAVAAANSDRFISTALLILIVSPPFSSGLVGQDPVFQLQMNHFFFVATSQGNWTLSESTSSSTTN